MKYLVLLAADEKIWPDLSAAERSAALADHDTFTREVEQRGAIVGGEALGESDTATTLRHAGGRRDGEVLLTDGPYAETVEHIGGFYLIEMSDLDQMTELCALLPAWYAVEIRPVVDAPLRP